MEINNDMISSVNESVKDDIVYFKTAIEKKIDTLSKKSMRRLLKVYSGFSFANEIIGNKPLKLSEEENQLLKTAMKLQEDCLGYSKLKDELNKGDLNG
jgi:hypothetical protein